MDLRWWTRDSIALPEDVLVRVHFVEKVVKLVHLPRHVDPGLAVPVQVVAVAALLVLPQQGLHPLLMGHPL